MELTLNQALHKAIEAHKAGQAQDADRLYTAILQAQPKHPDANHNLGVLAVGLGKVEEALPFFKTALEANQGIAQFWLSYIDALIKLDRFADAKSILEQAGIKGVKGESFDKLKQSLNEPIETSADARPDSNGKENGLSNARDPSQEQLLPLINLYRQGQSQQALKQASELLRNFPSSFTLHNICGAANTELKLYDAAIDSFKQALNIKPDYAEVYCNMGLAQAEQGELEAAIASYNKALKIKPDIAEAHYNIGNAQKDKGETESAIASFKQALKIKPNYSEAHSNMGLSLQENGDLEAAIDSFKQALKIRPDLAEAYSNLGRALQEKGVLEAAINNFKQALKINPDLVAAYSNYESILIQDIASYGLPAGQVILNIEKPRALIYEQPIHQVFRSIFNYISGDFDASRENLNQYSHLFTSGEFEKLNRADQVFCTAYSDFLPRLMERNPLASDSNLAKIYHIGESHCLSYAHCNINVNNQPSTIFPAITFGAKAYHFANDQENRYKAVTRRNLNAIPKASTVFVSFGEIDCRTDEGLLLAAEKAGLKLQELVEKTVAGYIAWFENANEGSRHKLHFFNVPAPVNNERAVNVVALFNEALGKEVRKSESLLIDVYKYTKDAEGVSNNLYHCDGFHLDNRILNVIKDQLNL